MRFLKRHQVIDVKIARIGEDATGIRGRTDRQPAMTWHLPGPSVTATRLSAISTSCRVFWTIPIGIGPPGKITFAVIGCGPWSCLLARERPPMAVIATSLSVVMTPGTIQPTAMGKGAGGEDEGINKGGELHTYATCWASLVKRGCASHDIGAVFVYLRRKYATLRERRLGQNTKPPPIGCPKARCWATPA